MPEERKHKVTLTEEEREQLRKLLTSGKVAARKLNHARMLLYADAGAAGLRRTDQEITERLWVGLRTVARVRQRLVEEGYAAALQPRPRGAYKVDAHPAAQMLELAASQAPPGHKRWTLRLLAERLVV